VAGVAVEDPEAVRRREREHEKQERVEAHAANVRLGVVIAEGLHEVSLTRETARLVGLLVFEGHVGGHEPLHGRRRRRRRRGGVRGVGSTDGTPGVRRRPAARPPAGAAAGPTPRSET